jgi:hypothetical protein
MRTQTKYEEIILNEIRTLPIPVVPQALKMLRVLKEGILNAAKQGPVVAGEQTGFCGTWQDEKSADEIMSDITSHRSGFGCRRLTIKIHCHPRMPLSGIQSF